MRDRKLMRLSAKDRKLRLTLIVSAQKPKKLSVKDRKLRLKPNVNSVKLTKQSVYDRKLPRRQKDCRQLRLWRS